MSEFMGTEQGKEGFKPLPSFEEMMEQARQRFMATESYDPNLPGNPFHGKTRESYSFMVAGWDTADYYKESGVNMFALAGKLMQETVDLTDMNRDPHIENIQTWEDLPLKIVRSIIDQQMPRCFPELIEEDRRRNDLYNR